MCGFDPSPRQAGKKKFAWVAAAASGELFDLSSFNTSGGLLAENLSSYFLSQSDEGEAH